MATTVEGRRTTEDHRLAQLAIAAAAVQTVRPTWATLDVDDIDSSSFAWQMAMTRIITRYFRVSETRAARYVAAFRKAEGAKPAAVVRPEMNLAETMRTLTYAGPVMLKKRIGRGVPPEVAHRANVSHLEGVVQQQVLAGGRSVVDHSARQGYGRYRRVTDADPCAFCAMLASRGPVYSEESRYFEAHPRCGCTAEEVIGGWDASKRELEWRRSYAEAADQVRRPGKPLNVSAVLAAMRRNDPDLFSDGVR
ncbi:MAG TPA: hypothetical protein VK059_07600 [Nocardioidaceae bacterium]|nr:hypothetical protein [Nocardioidaceae bacterium]